MLFYFQITLVDVHTPESGNRYEIPSKTLNAFMRRIKRKSAWTYSGELILIRRERVTRTRAIVLLPVIEFFSIRYSYVFGIRRSV